MTPWVPPEFIHVSRILAIIFICLFLVGVIFGIFTEYRSTKNVKGLPKPAYLISSGLGGVFIAVPGMTLVLIGVIVMSLFGFDEYKPNYEALQRWAHKTYDLQLTDDESKLLYWTMTDNTTTEVEGNDLRLLKIENSPGYYIFDVTEKALMEAGNK